MSLPMTATTMESLKDDNVEDILLRLPSWASLGHAVRAADHFRHIASNPDFLRRFRAGHDSASPRGLLGVFAQRYPIGLPVFIIAGPARSDPGLLAVARTGDFLLGDLEDDPEWALHDCRNGRLLLSRGRSLTIYDPVSRRRIDISLPQDDPVSPNGDESAIHCLLADEYSSSFRVVSLHVYDRSRRLRAVEYDSTVQEWRFHPWAADAITPPKYQTMYAAGLIFWNHEWMTDSATFMLDTRTMEFSRLLLPEKIEAATRWLSLRSLRCSMGETEDGKCCLVYVSNRKLQVWLLGKSRSGGNTWEFQKEKPLADLLPGHNCDEHYFGNVVAGLVILRAGNNGSHLYHHYVFDLKNLSVKAKLPDAGFRTVVYPIQLPWPPAGLSPAKRPMLQIDTTRQDAEKKQKTSSSSSKGLSPKLKEHGA